jgi:photosynthetic reaction center cytochrome c subunit
MTHFNSAAIFTLLAVLIPFQGAVRAQEPKTAGESFKNIQVLKRVPADQWFDTMAFIAGSLGVTCDHCHSDRFETDEGNPNKLKAREMMRMVDDINNRAFGGRQQVTCNTCHRGSIKPQGNPTPSAGHWLEAAEKPLEPLASQEILSRYRRTMNSVRTQSISLQVETYGGKGPARLKSADVLLDGDNVRISEKDGAVRRTMIRNGKSAWIDEEKGWRVMSKGETFDAFEIADVLAADQVGNVEPTGQVSTVEVSGSKAYVLPVKNKNSRELLYFDPKTFLLLRQRLLFSSFYGDGAVDINYKDFRNVGNSILPSTVEVVNAGGAGLIVRRVISRKINVKLAESEFHAPGS